MVQNQSSNYHSISILSPFSKLFEKCIYEQIYFTKFLSLLNLALNKIFSQNMQQNICVMVLPKILMKTEFHVVFFGLK